MSRDPKEFSDDLMKIENRFIDNYEKMNIFLEFFERIKEVLFSREEISIREIEFLQQTPETAEILPFTYSILINQKSYLLIFNDMTQPRINEEELQEYRNLFTESKNEDGLIIIWNDDDLSSFKLYKDKIYSPIEKFKVKPLTQLLDKEIKFRKRFIDLIEKQIKQIEKAKAPDPIEQFNSDLPDTFEYFKSRRFHTDKREQMDKLNLYELNPFIKIFSDFILEKIDIEEFDKRFNEIISRGNSND